MIGGHASMQPYQDPRINVRHARAFAGGPEPRAREPPALTESLEETKWEPIMQCKQPYHGSLCICRGTERRTATGKLFRRCRRRRACVLTV